MKQVLFIIILSIFYLNTNAQIPDTYLNNKSLEYNKVIKYYQELANKYPEAELLKYGKTDIGKPLHLFVISSEKVFNPKELHKQGKCIILINNGIHPGEPEGIDASLHLSENILKDKKYMKKNMKNVVLCIIPVYNVGGALNRSPYNRANQQTPPQHGFRGNARHLDLNRDFVKNATQNSQTFAKIFHLWNPEIFLDTHTTDGSDHQHVITLIPTYYGLFPDNLGKFFNDTFVPFLFQEMEKTPYKMIPYVYTMKKNNPEYGIQAYLDKPKLSTGYANLFNTMGFMTENHIFKDFKDRVQSVMFFENALISFANNNYKQIVENKKIADNFTAKQKKFAVDYILDTNNIDSVNFMGYHAEISKSPLTGINRIVYNHDKPYEKNIPFYKYYIPVKFINAPKAYILPQSHPEIIERLKYNNVQMSLLKKDTIIELTTTYIDDYKTSKRQNNAHFTHYDVKIHREKQIMQCYAGDYLIIMNQKANRYIVQMLEPQGMDSFFKWNFFDEILETREYFSPIGFEQNAIDYLMKNPNLNKQFKEAVKKDKKLRKSHYLQLKYIYLHSEYAEKSFKRLPIYRIEHLN